VVVRVTVPRLPFAAALVVVLAASGCVRARTQVLRQTDWAFLDLRGRVERVTRITLRPLTGTAEEELVATGTTTWWFDTDGFLTEEKWYGPAGQPSGSSWYGQTASGDRTARWLDEKGALQQRTIVVYDARGRRAEEKYYDRSGGYTGGYRYEYDASGRLFRRSMETIYAPDDRRTGNSEFDHDTAGRLVEERYYEEALGGLANRVVYRYRGDLLASRADYTRGTQLVFLAFYEHDGIGNVVRESNYQIPEEESGDRYAGAIDEKDLPRSFLSSVVKSEYRYHPEE